jgi:hypothetical protein
MPIKTRLGVDSGTAATKKVPKKRPRSLTEEKKQPFLVPLRQSRIHATVEAVPITRLFAPQLLQSDPTR